MKKKFLIILTMIMSFMLSISPVFADSEDECIAMGANLSDSEQSTVLKLLDLDKSDLENKKVIYITNEDEYKYLDSYIDSSKIGTRALSSVRIRENSDDTISVKTYNITYCTEGMYRNALATAGVKGADVTVAGPYNISGTAALVGTIKAYENMSGEEIDDDVIGSSIDEVLTTGEVGESIGDTEKAEAIIAEAKKELAEDPEISEDEIREIVKAASDKAGIELTDEQLDDIVKMLQRMQDSGADWDNIKEQSKSIMESFKNVINSEEAQNVFEKFVSWISDIFDGLKNH